MRRPSLDARWAQKLSPALLNEALPHPLYHQVYLVLNALIREEGFEAGAPVPGEADLAHLLSVSRITVKRALDELAARGLVSRGRGRGTAITAQAARSPLRSSFDELLACPGGTGSDLESELLEAEDTTAGEAGVAIAMELTAEARVRRAAVRRLSLSEPLSYLVSYTRSAPAPSAGDGLCAAEHWVTAVAAPPQVAVTLDVAVAAPILKIKQILRNGDGQVVQLIHGYYRPDRFEYAVQRNMAGWGLEFT